MIRFLQDRPNVTQCQFSVLQSPLSALQSPLAVLQSPLLPLQGRLTALQGPLSALQGPLNLPQCQLTGLQGPLKVVHPGLVLALIYMSCFDFLPTALCLLPFACCQRIKYLTQRASCAWYVVKDLI